MKQTMVIVFWTVNEMRTKVQKGYIKFPVVVAICRVKRRRRRPKGSGKKEKTIQTGMGGKENGKNHNECAELYLAKAWVILSQRVLQ